MESELIGNLELFLSPTAMQAMRKKSAEKAGSTVTKAGLSHLTSAASSSSRDGGTGGGSEEAKECKVQAEAEPSGLCSRLHGPCSAILRMLLLCLEPSW